MVESTDPEPTPDVARSELLGGRSEILLPLALRLPSWFAALLITTCGSLSLTFWGVLVLLLASPSGVATNPTTGGIAVTTVAIFFACVFTYLAMLVASPRYVLTREGILLPRIAGRIRIPWGELGEARMVGEGELAQVRIPIERADAFTSRLGTMDRWLLVVTHIYLAIKRIWPLLLTGQWRSAWSMVRETSPSVGFVVEDERMGRPELVVRVGGRTRVWHEALCRVIDECRQSYGAVSDGR